MADLGGKSGGGGQGWVRTVDVDPTSGDDVVDTKVFDASGTILQSCRSSSLSVDVTVQSSFPEIEIDGQNFVLPEDPGGGFFEDTVSVTLSAAGAILVITKDPDGSAAANDTFTLALESPPQLLTLSFAGGYPGSQTELKAGDTVQVTGTTDKALDAVFIQDSGAGTGELVTGLSGTSFTATLTIANRGTSVQALAASVQARDAVTGALGIARATNHLGGTTDGVDLVFLNNFFFSLSYGTVTYPPTQSALKDAESATVAVTTDYVGGGSNSIAYTSPGSELSITNPNTNEATKTVGRIGGTYNVVADGGVVNLTATLTRAANAAVTVESTTISIAHIAAALTVTHPGARIRSGAGVGADTVVTMTFDQLMQATPAMSPAASRGTFQGVFVDSGDSKSWTATLRVLDSENPTDGSANAWTSVSATNLAGRVTTTVTTNPTYVVGGFTARDLSYAAFTADSAETFPLTTEANLSIGSFDNGNVGVVQPFGTADQNTTGTEGWWAPNAASGSTTGRMLHAPTVAANSGGLVLGSVEETA